MKKTLLLLTSLILIAGCTSEQEWIPLSEDFEIINCDALTQCPQGYSCISFQDLNAPICWNKDPCSRCKTSSCLQLESYPVQIRCE